MRLHFPKALSSALGGIEGFHNDHLGTPLFLTDAAGTVVWKGQYLPFGDVFSGDRDPDGDGVEVTQPFRFPGQYEDAETGLYYNYFRDYDPTLGRYIEADPIGLAGGVNLWGYAGNNPIALIDPEGLYGTNDCSYYQQRCEEVGGKYYCDTAQYWCNWFGKPPDPNPLRDDDYEGWYRCTRQCLQDCDAENAQCEDIEQVDDFLDPIHTDCHFKCYLECLEGKVTGENPY